MGWACLRANCEEGKTGRTLTFIKPQSCQEHHLIQHNYPMNPIIILLLDERKWRFRELKLLVQGLHREKWLFLDYLSLWITIKGSSQASVVEFWLYSLFLPSVCSNACHREAFLCCVYCTCNFAHLPTPQALISLSNRPCLHGASTSLPYSCGK